MSDRWTVIKGGGALAETWKVSRDLPNGVLWIEFADIEPEPGNPGSISIFVDERTANEAAVAFGGRTAKIVDRPGGGWEIALSKKYPGVVRS